MKGISGASYPLCALVSIRKGQQINGEFLAESGSYKMLNGGINPSGFIEQYNTQAGMISISEGGNSCGYVQFNNEPFWSGGHCYTLESNEKDYNYKYLYHYLKFRQDDIMALRIGSGLPNIQKKDLEKFEVVLPEKSVQDRLVSMFLSVDKRIEIEELLLRKFLIQKQFLLRKLFI